jgi:hypothetical protein
METKVAVRSDEANLQVGGAASKVWLTHGELYLETGGFTAAIRCRALCSSSQSVYNKPYQMYSYLQPYGTQREK